MLYSGGVGPAPGNMYDALLVVALYKVISIVHKMCGKKLIIVQLDGIHVLTRHLTTDVRNAIAATEQLSAKALYDHHENALNLSERTAGSGRLFLTTGKEASQTGAPAASCSGGLMRHFRGSLGAADLGEIPYPGVLASASRGFMKSSAECIDKFYTDVCNTSS